MRRRPRRASCAPLDAKATIERSDSPSPHQPETLITRLSLCALAALLTPCALAAQQPGSGSNPTTDAAKGMNSHFGQLLMSATDEVPADKLAYKPTDAQMTFGQVWAHLADANRTICSAIGGMAKPATPSGRVPRARTCSSRS